MNASPAHPPPKVLVVDDSPTVRQMIALTVERAGCDAIQASDGVEALAKATRSRFALVVTDQNMPGMDGLSLVRALRALPAYRPVPILILTTESGDGLKAQARAAGASGWMAKPFDPARLLDVVHKLIS